MTENFQPSGAHPIFQVVMIACRYDPKSELSLRLKVMSESNSEKDKETGRQEIEKRKLINQKEREAVKQQQWERSGARDEDRDKYSDKDR